MPDKCCGTCLYADKSGHVPADWLECSEACTNDGLAMSEDTLAFAMDAKSFAAWLCIHRTFCCSMWRDKGDA